MKPDSSVASQTFQSFSDKWHNNKDLGFSETLNPASTVCRWILERNGFDTIDALRNELSKSSRVLDAGCGNGRVSALLRSLMPSSSELVGLDLTAADVAKENIGPVPHTSFFSADLTQLNQLEPYGQFDFIYCQEVLHHTSNPFKAFKNLTQLLAPGGKICIYVYKKKAPIREYVDDFVRDRIKDLDYHDAISSMNQLTQLAKVLSDIDLEVDVPAVDVLDIPQGTYTVQRLIYHFFMKCFWNPEFSFDDNVAINYDWYHPSLCTRHTTDEVHSWFSSCNLSIVHTYSDFYGITVHGRRTK